MSEVFLFLRRCPVPNNDRKRTRNFHSGQAFVQIRDWMRPAVWHNNGI